MNERRVEVQGGSIFVREDGAGPPVLFLHGPEDPEWTPALTRLASELRVVAPDHPGMGRSALGPGLDTMDDLVGYYLDLIDTLALPEATVVGASFGGWVAAELAVALGPRLRRLVLANAAGLRVGDTDLPEIYLMAEDELARFLVADPGHAARVTPPTEDPALFERRLTQRATLARFTWHPYWHDPKLAERLRRVAAPTLVLWGAEDRFIPVAHGREFVTRIPDATLRLVPGAGHLPHLEQPELFAAAIADFVKSSAGRSR